MWFPVAFFVWKPLDMTELWEDKEPGFLESIRGPVEHFHKKLKEAKEVPNRYDGWELIGEFMESVIECSRNLKGP